MIWLWATQHAQRIPIDSNGNDAMQRLYVRGAGELLLNKNSVGN